MSEYVGTVTKVASTDWNGMQLHSFQIDTMDNQWFRTGAKETGLEVGQSIRFQQSGNAKVDPKAIEQISADDATAAKETAAASKSAPRTSPRQVRPTKNDYWTERQKWERSMQPKWDWGRARSDAALIVQTALTTGALEFPKAANNAKKLGLITAYLHEVTQELIDKEDNLGE